MPYGQDSACLFLLRSNAQALPAYIAQRSGRAGVFAPERLDAIEWPGTATLHSV